MSVKNPDLAAAVLRFYFILMCLFFNSKRDTATIVLLVRRLGGMPKSGKYSALVWVLIRRKGQLITDR